jgi:hypothetical protein
MYFQGALTYLQKFPVPSCMRVSGLKSWLDCFVTAALHACYHNFKQISADCDDKPDAMSSMTETLYPATANVAELKGAEYSKLDDHDKRTLDVVNNVDAYMHYGACEELYTLMRRRGNSIPFVTHEEVVHQLAWTIASRDFVGVPDIVNVKAVHVEEEPLRFCRLDWTVRSVEVECGCVQWI